VSTVSRPRELLLGAVAAIRERLSAVASQSGRTILLGTVLLASAVSAVTGFVLAQYYSIDVLSSLVFVPDDCYLDWPMKVGRHCFSDYAMPVSYGMRPNAWEPYTVYTHSGFRVAHNNYPAAGVVPEVMFGFLGKWLAAPRLGLLGYQLVLTIACLSPAVWAARGARGLERVVVFVVCGAAAVPAWMVIDRGNSVGFMVPAALVFLVALCRRRWGMVAIMVVLAALVKPQFAVLAVALFAARQWRWGGIAVVGVVVSNLAAYLLWPRDFPRTIMQSVHNAVDYTNGTFQAVVGNSNVAFGKGLLAAPDAIKARETGGTIPDGFLAGPRSLLGYAVLVLVVVSLLALGRRIPPVMAGIVMLATASLFPPLSNPYYLVFVLPVAALVARDPDGPPGTGIFDRFGTGGGRRRAVGICVSLAAALCIAQIALPSPPVLAEDLVGEIRAGAMPIVVTTVFLAPQLWLLACASIIVSYARRPAPSHRSDQGPAPEVSPDTALSTLRTSEPITEFSPQRQA
jgi:hypothetical protein